MSQCEVQLSLDSQHLQNSPSLRGEEKVENSGSQPSQNSHSQSRDSTKESRRGSRSDNKLKTYCNPFYIEYIEQDILIQKTILYRITLKDHALLETAKFELNFTLHHVSAAEESKPSFSMFTPAANEKITLRNLFNVQQYFVPLHFERSFLSLTNVSIFASLGGLTSMKPKRRVSYAENIASSLEDFDDTGSWSSFLSFKSNTSPSKAEQDLPFASTITEDDLKSESPEVLEALMERLQGTLSQLFVLESVAKTKQMSGAVSEFRQSLMSLPTKGNSSRTRSESLDRTQMAKELMKLLIELRKLCRFVIMQHTSPAQNMIKFLFEHWRASRFKVWSKYIAYQRKSEYSTVPRKPSKIDMMHQMYYTDEKFSAKSCPTIITDQPSNEEYNPADEAPILDILRLHEFPEVMMSEDDDVCVSGPSPSNSFLTYLNSDDGRQGGPKHIVFLVHGFMGGPQDLRFFHSFLKLRYPHVICHYSKENFKRTDSSFEDMGRRLAKEVFQVVQRIVPSTSREGEQDYAKLGVDDLRISFVGHSIGNIIVRAALAMPEMKDLLKHLWTFLSVTGPHTGFQGVNVVQKAAFVFLTKFRKIRSICELSMCDEENYKDTFLYRLSQQTTFAHFRFVLLLGSKQDGYVNKGSATMTKLVNVEKDGKLHGQLVDNFIKEMSNSSDLSASGRTSQTYRYILDFPKLREYSLFQQVIGRAAHVELLCSPTYIPVYVWCLLTPDMFGLPLPEKIEIQI